MDQDKTCNTCINVRGLGKKHFAPHYWCNIERAYFERDHACKAWEAQEV